jgi:hypothetical protein
MEEGASDIPSYVEEEEPPRVVPLPRTVSRAGTQPPGAVVREPSMRRRPPTHLAHEEEEVPHDEPDEEMYYPPETPPRAGKYCLFFVTVYWCLISILRPIGCSLSR